MKVKEIQFKTRFISQPRQTGDDKGEKRAVIIFKQLIKRWFRNKYYWGRWKKYGRYYSWSDGIPQVEEFDSIKEAEEEIIQLKKDLKNKIDTFSNLLRNARAEE